VGTRCADHVTPLYPQKLALTSPTGGGRSVGIVRVRIKATEFFLERQAFWACSYMSQGTGSADYSRNQVEILERHLPHYKRDFFMQCPCTGIGVVLYTELAVTR